MKTGAMKYTLRIIKRRRLTAWRISLLFHCWITRKNSHCKLYTLIPCLQIRSPLSVSALGQQQGQNELWPRTASTSQKRRDRQTNRKTPDRCFTPFCHGRPCGYKYMYLVNKTVRRESYITSTSFTLLYAVFLSYKLPNLVRAWRGRKILYDNLHIQIYIAPKIVKTNLWRWHRMTRR